MCPAFLSVRKDAASTMAGAIFMSNTATRDQCFQTGVFGLPREYESFIYNVRKQMPLFLFDYNLRKLYGVFEATSDGGLSINSDAFQCAYPAQVRVSIIWKCRPLSEDEFSSAIKENYYSPRKFYFDLSYKQVVRLYELFDDKRVGHPIYNHTEKNEILGAQDLTKRVPDNRSLTPNASHSDDNAHRLIPDISAIVGRYSSHTSKHTVLPHSIVQPSTTLPLGVENFGPQIAFMQDHHDQTEYPCQGEHLQAAGSRSYSQYHDYPQKVLSSGRIIQGLTQGAKSAVNQPYSLSHDFVHNSISSGYVTQNPLPALSLGNTKGNADNLEHCGICIRQRYLNEGKALPSAQSSPQGISVYPDVLEFKGSTSAVGQKKNGFADYIPLSDCGKNSENASDSSDHENYMGVDMSDRRNNKHVIGAESNTIVPQSTIFSRISLNRQPPSPEATGPSLNQLVYSLSQKAKLWNYENGPNPDGFSCIIREQTTDEPYSHSELSLPSQLELEAEAGESTEPQLPFLNFKRRSEARNVDANLVKKINGKAKRRKLVRPSFGENNASTCSGNCINERNDHVKVGGNHLDIDLNTPAIVDNDQLEKDNSIQVRPGFLTKTQTEKPCEDDANKTHISNLMDTMKEQVPSFHNDTPAKRFSFDVNISELTTMEESKLQTIIDQTSSLLQAISKIASVKSTNFEEFKSSIREL